MEVKANVDTVLLGRILAGVIIAITFVYGIYGATEFNGFWSFLSAITLPLAVGFLIIMVTEVVKEMQQHGKQDSSQD